MTSRRPGPAASPGAAGPETAVAALRRAAWLLEGLQADPYRAAAFRHAVRAVEPLGPDRLAALAAAGTLTDVPGVGARTAQVLTQVLRGEPVPYLDELERTAAAAAGPDPGEPAAALRAAVRGDLHAHTEASDGTTSMQEMVLGALEVGHEYLVVTDHSPRLTVAHGLTAARLRDQIAQIDALRAPLAPFRLLRGIEVDILADGTLDQDPDLLGALDVVVASVHSDLRADRATMTARMLRAVRDPHTDVLGHCTGRRVTGRVRPPSDFDASAVFEACAEHGVAVEINCRPDRVDPPDALLAVAVASGCVFAIDTDAHAPGHLAWQIDGCVRAAALGIGPDRVVNTLPAEELVARRAG